MLDVAMYAARGQSSRGEGREGGGGEDGGGENGGAMPKSEQGVILGAC